MSNFGHSDRYLHICCIITNKNFLRKISEKFCPKAIGKKGSDKCTNSSSPRQFEKDLPRNPTEADRHSNKHRCLNANVWICYRFNHQHSNIGAECRWLNNWSCRCLNVPFKHRKVFKHWRPMFERALQTNRHDYTLPKKGHLEINKHWLRILNFVAFTLLAKLCVGTIK